MESNNTKKLHNDQNKNNDVKGKNKDNKKGLAAGMAVGAAGIAGGVAGYAAVDMADVAEQPVEVQEDVVAQNVQPTAAPAVEPVEESVAPVENTEAPVAETQQVTPEEVMTPVSETPVVETPTNNEPVTAQTEPTNQTETPVSNPEVVAPRLDEPANPDDVAEVVLRGEEIDPNDIDAEDMVIFDEVGMVYTVDGESYAAATFHDNDGNEMIMADMDGDEQFDVILTPDMDVVAEMELPINYSDAEMQVNANPEYMAQTDLDNNTGLEGEDYMDDMILS